MLVLPSKSAVVWDKFIKENKVLVFKYIVRALHKALLTNNEKIDLFKFDDDSMSASIHRKNVLQTLDEALKIFIDAEEYEYAQKTKRVIMKYQIDNLIKESNKLED